MVRFLLAMTNSPVVRVIVPVSVGSKVMVSPVAASAIAWRNDPVPESFVLVTVPPFATAQNPATAIRINRIFILFSLHRHKRRLRPKVLIQNAVFWMLSACTRGVTFGSIPRTGYGYAAFGLSAEGDRAFG